VPASWAYDVLLFCQRNPRPCPVLDVTDPGSFRTTLAPEADLRTDLPSYRIWRDGELDRPDFGDPVVMRRGDVPVFWACGVTRRRRCWPPGRRSRSPTRPGTSSSPT
jgi:uncharacterized protein YcsI (UPF0317 family)